MDDLGKIYLTIKILVIEAQNNQDIAQLALNALNQGQGKKNDDEESDDEQEIGGGEIYRVNNTLQNMLKDKIPAHEAIVENEETKESSSHQKDGLNAAIAISANVITGFAGMKAPVNTTTGGMHNS